MVGSRPCPSPAPQSAPGFGKPFSFPLPTFIYLTLPQYFKIRNYLFRAVSNLCCTAVIISPGRFDGFTVHCICPKFDQRGFPFLGGVPMQLYSSFHREHHKC